MLYRAEAARTIARAGVAVTVLSLLSISTIGCAGRPNHAKLPSAPIPDRQHADGWSAITQIEGLVSNGVLTLRARFAPGTFEARTTRVAWVLDTDHNPDTGSAGLFGAPGVRAHEAYDSSDTGIIAADAVALVTGTCGSGSLTLYNRQSGTWVLADLVPAIASSDGFEAYVALDSVAANAHGISFKVVSYKYSGDCPPASINYAVKDVSPQVGEPSAIVQQATTGLASPQPIAPANMSSFDHYPRRTILDWWAVPGAAAYMVQAQYADPTASSGWRPLIFSRVSDLRTEFNFVGAQAGRWRVWALNRDGLAGAPSSWLTFRYLR